MRSTSPSGTRFSPAYPHLLIVEIERSCCFVQVSAGLRVAGQLSGYEHVMSTRTSTASARWHHDTVTGSGTVSTESGSLHDAPLTWRSRIGEAAGSTPEELLAGAHAGCFAMALSFALTTAGHTPEQLDVTASAEFVFTGTGASVTAMHLTVDGLVPGIDPSQFEQLAEGAKDGCPISAVFAGNVPITLTARLAETV